MAEKLFTEFPPVSTTAWEEVITKDLKGADYEKKLVWKTYDGFSVRPYYRAEDLQGLKYVGKNPGEFPFVRGTKQNNRWFINESVCCGDIAAANSQALTLLTKGVESFIFHLPEGKVMEVADYTALLKGISLEKVPVNFRGCCPKNVDGLKNFLKYVDSLGIDKDTVRATFDFSPLRPLNKKEPLTSRL